MADVILLYDDDCPNVAAARSNLLKAFATTGHSSKYHEVNLRMPATPAHLRGFGSPTILVDGRDVAGVEPASDARCCRVYRTPTGQLVGAPSVEQIAQALRRNGSCCTHSLEDTSARVGRGWKGSLAVLPAIAVALLPNLTCPACWPAYAALLSSAGIGFLPTTKYLLPLTVVGLAFALVMLVWDARRRHRMGPLVVGSIGVVVVLVGRFTLQLDVALYTGVAVLVAAAVWNAWPIRKQQTSAGTVPAGSCPACDSH